MGRARKPDLLADAILDGIKRNKLKPGDRLPAEARMVERYEVGRATVREALRLLEANGVVEIRVGAAGGAFVAQPQPQRLVRLLSSIMQLSGISLREVLDTRRIIQPQIAAEAAVRGTDEELESLRTAHSRLNVSLDAEEWRAVNGQFHAQIAAMSHNRPLELMWGALRTIIGDFEGGVRYPTSRRKEVVARRAKIVEAIEAHDSAAAQAEMALDVEQGLIYLTRFYPHLLEERIEFITND